MSDLQELDQTDASDENEEVTTPEVMAAFEEAVSEDKPHDAIKVAMLQAGAAFAGVTSLFNKLMVATGRAMSKEDKSELVAKSCVDNDLTTQEGFEASIAAIKESSEYDITDRSAAGLVRGYAKRTGVEGCYKAPKVEGAGRGRHGFKANFFDWLREDPTRTAEDLNQLVLDYGTRNVLKDKPFYNSIRLMANDIASGTAPTTPPEFVVPTDKTAVEALEEKAKAAENAHEGTEQFED